MKTLARGYDSSNTIRFNLQTLFYYSFLATFTVIIFTNIMPSDWMVITRPFVLFTTLLSISLIDNKKVILYILLLYIFLFMYTLYPLITNDTSIEYVIKNTRFMLYFVFIIGLANIFKTIPLERLLYGMSKVFVIKLFVVALISLNVNFGGAWFLGTILNGIELNVHNLFGAYRIFDIYLFLFPLIFIYIKNKKKNIKIMIHILLLFNILSSMTFGIIFAYILIMFLRYRFIKIGAFIFIGLAILIFHEYLFNLYNIFLIEKSISIEVKMNQFLFLIDNISLWGQGLGTLITIQGRTDSMLENIFIYWIVIYGIIGSVFMITYFIIFPFLVCYKFKKEFSIIILFYMHLSVLIASATNPYFESVIGMIAMMMIVAYFFSKKQSIKT